MTDYGLIRCQGTGGAWAKACLLWIYFNRGVKGGFSEITYARRILLTKG